MASKSKLTIFVFDVDFICPMRLAIVCSGAATEARTDAYAALTAQFGSHSGARIVQQPGEFAAKLSTLPAGACPVKGTSTREGETLPYWAYEL